MHQANRPKRGDHPFQAQVLADPKSLIFKFNGGKRHFSDDHGDWPHSDPIGQRLHEVGIRMALGAQPGGILKMLMGQGLRLTLAELAAGAAAALALTRILAAVSCEVTRVELFYNINPSHPVIFSGLGALLLLCRF